MTLLSFSDTFNTMSKILIKLFQVSSILFIALSLSGCKAVGKTENAALQVTSNPQASVFLDDKHLGKTPFYSDQIKEGTHNLKVVAGEATYIDKVELKGGALTVVNRNLNNNILAQSGEILWLVDGKNDLFLASTPPRADIIIDGELKGKTPILIRDLESGDHKVRLTKPGYTQQEFAVKTSTTYKLLANVSLSSKEAKNPQVKEESNVEKIEVLATTQGFLRVHKEPQLNSQEVGQVDTGTSYEIIQETEDWIKISFEGKLGWISKQYTKGI